MVKLAAVLVLAQACTFNVPIDQREEPGIEGDGSFLADAGNASQFLGSLGPEQEPAALADSGGLEAPEDAAGPELTLDAGSPLGAAGAAADPAEGQAGEEAPTVQDAGPPVCVDTPLEAQATCAGDCLGSCTGDCSAFDPTGLACAGVCDGKCIGTCRVCSP